MIINKKIIIFIQIFTISKLVKPKNLNFKCSKYYNVSSNESCAEVIEKYGLENVDFFNLNPNVNCSEIQNSRVCIEGEYTGNILNNMESDYKVILSNSTLNESFNYYGKLSYKEFEPVYKLLDNSFLNQNYQNFDYNKCCELCKKGQSYYESIVKNKSNPYNFKEIIDINYFYGLSTPTLMEDPLNNCLRFCKNGKLINKEISNNNLANRNKEEEKNVENGEERMQNEKDNESTQNIEKREYFDYGKSANSQQYQIPQLELVSTTYGPDYKTILYRNYKVTTNTREKFRNQVVGKDENGKDIKAELYALYTRGDGCSFGPAGILRSDEIQIQTVMNSVCNRHDICYFCHNSQSYCDNLLVSQTDSICSAYKNYNQKLYDECRKEHRYIEYGISIPGINLFFSSSYKNAQESRKIHQRGVFKDLICPKNIVNFLLNNNHFVTLEKKNHYSETEYCGETHGICQSGCCSQYGYCGDTSEHCGIGCNPLYGYCKKEGSPGQCGQYYGKCGDGNCCSEYGYCGTTSAYCGKGCQKEFGKCK